MEEIWPFALGAAALVLVRPLRRRVKPVAGAVVRAGLGLVGASVVGVSGVANAVVRGQARPAGETSGR
jgi:hypothetical protein